MELLEKVEFENHFGLNQDEILNCLVELDHDVISKSIEH